MPKKTMAAKKRPKSKGISAFKFTGDLDPAKVEHAVKLSKEKYCGVGAMLEKTATIETKIDISS